MEETVSGSLLLTTTRCKVIQQLEGPRPGSGEEPVSVNTAHLRGLIISRHVPALSVTPVRLIRLQTGGDGVWGSTLGAAGG